MNGWGNVESGEDRVEVFQTLDEARERFGENYRGFVFRLSRVQAEELLRGKVVAFDIGGREYAGFLTVEPAEATSGRTSMPTGKTDA